MHESFELSRLDIEAWMSVLTEQGCEKIVLQGHSLGTAKVVYYLTETEDCRVMAIVLASPPDMVGLRRRNLDEEHYAYMLELAKGRVVSGKADSLMPDEAIPGYLISASAFLSLFGPKSKADIFPIQRGKGFKRLASIRIPILVFYGTLDRAAVCNPEESLEIIRRHCKASPDVDTAIVQGASHNYLKYEEQVADLIGHWLSKIVSSTNSS